MASLCVVRTHKPWSINDTHMLAVGSSLQHQRQVSSAPDFTSMPVIVSIVILALTPSTIGGAPASGGSKGGRVFASPLAKALAKEKGYDLASIKGMLFRSSYSAFE